jgi:hypothetical protein
MHTLNRGGRAIGLDAGCKLLLRWGCCGVCVGVGDEDVVCLIGVVCCGEGWCFSWYYELVFGLFGFLTFYYLTFQVWSKADPMSID